MSTFVPTKHDLRTSLIFCFHLKKNASQAHRMLVEAYGQHALGLSQCTEWLKKFKRGDFNLRNEERGRAPKKFEDADLRALLDEDGTLTQQKLAKMLNVSQKTISFRLKAIRKTELSTADQPDSRLSTHPCNEPSCDKTFSNRRHMRAHWELEHSPLRDGQLMCDRCSHPLASKRKLQLHIAWHERHPKKQFKPTMQQCEVPFCGRKYVQRHTLVQHYRQMHPDVAVPE